MMSSPSRTAAICSLAIVVSFAVGGPSVAAQPALPSSVPAVHLESYTGKPTRTLSFSGSGFMPGESVDMFLGDQTLDPLVTVTADARGDIFGQNVGIPFLAAGDYKASFVGRSSAIPVTFGFNIQGFHPWVVLRDYYLSPQASVGFNGEDFVPGESVQVYLNSRLSSPVTQLTAGADGRFASEKAFSLPDLHGDNELIFVGDQSQTEVTATFSVASP